MPVSFLALKGNPLLSIPFRLCVPRSLYEEMLAQAIAEQPNECCGLLAGRVRPGRPAPEGWVERRYPLINAAASPTEYLSDARGMFDAHRDMRRRELEILAVYHSHPTSRPVPSRTDLARNYSPDVVNLIVSLEHEKPQTRGWWLTEHDYHAAEWTIID